MVKKEREDMFISTVRQSCCISLRPDF